MIVPGGHCTVSVTVVIYRDPAAAQRCQKRPVQGGEKKERRCCGRNTREIQSLLIKILAVSAYLGAPQNRICFQETLAAFHLKAESVCCLPGRVKQG